MTITPEKLDDFAYAYHDWQDWIVNGYGNDYDQVFNEKQSTYERLRSELLAAAAPPAAAPAPAVPGWKLVPVEPTQEMVRCAEMWDDGFEGAYARALAATPAAPAQEPMRSLTVPDDLPGMRDHSDLSGGETDAAPAQEPEGDFIPDGHAVLVTALDKIVEAHKFNLAALLPTEVHAIAFGALVEYTRLMDAAPAQEPVTLTDEETLDIITDWFDEESSIKSAKGLLKNFIAALREKEGRA